MKAIKFLAFGLLATMIASCSSDEIALTNKEVTATISGNIGTGLKTRAFNDQWEAGDSIGMFIYENIIGEGGDTTKVIFEENDNTKFTTDENGNSKEFKAASKEAIKFPSNQNSLTFHAYYPYTEGISVENPIFKPNWADQTKSQALDLLVSDYPIGSKTNNRVKLTFYHKFARIILNIDANTEESQIQYSDLKNLKITAADMSADVEYDVINDTCSKKEFNTEEIVFNTDSLGRYSSAIICPGVHDGDTTRVVTFELENGKKFKWKIDPAQTFIEGNSYTWNITLKGQDLVGAVLIGTIVNWNDGTIAGDKEFDLEEVPESNGGNTEGGSDDGSDNNLNEGTGDNSNEDTGEGSTDGPESNS